MKEQILRNLIRESIKKMISESTLKEYSGDSGLEELAEVLGYTDVIDFFEDNQGAVEAVYKWVESIPALRQQMKQSGMFESKLNEAEQTVKSEAASRLADFFRVPVHTLDKFNFDGNDNIQALSAALNSTSTQGTEMYYKMAIQLAKEELAVTESKIKEAINVNKRITTQQATKIAEKFAQYMSNKENKKFTVTKNSVDGPSFDLDVNGVEYDGGSYLIDTKGDIINVAITPNEVYGNISMLESSLKEANNLSTVGKADMHAKDIIKNYMQGQTVKDIQAAIKKEGLKGSALVDWIVEDMEIVEQEFGDGAIVTKKNYNTWIYEPTKVKDAAMKKAAKAIVANIDKYLSLKEADMSKRYDGFTVIDNKTKKQYKFRYIRGVDNVKDENDAIKTVMVVTKQPRSNFMVYNLIKKGDFDKTKGEVIESTNVMETKIKEAGGRRFIKSENIRQYNASKIKEANKKK